MSMSRDADYSAIWRQLQKDFPQLQEPDPRPAVKVLPDPRRPGWWTVSIDGAIYGSWDNYGQAVGFALTYNGS